MNADRKYFPVPFLHSHATAAMSWALRGKRNEMREALSHLSERELDSVIMAACLLVSAASDIADSLHTLAKDLDDVASLDPSSEDTWRRRRGSRNGYPA